MKNIDLFQDLVDHYSEFKEDRITGRFLSFQDLQPILEELKGTFQIEEIGKSFLEVPIHTVKIGSGPIKVMGWSQMHGNESTTTKSLLDLFRLFSGRYIDTPLISQIMDSITFLVIPMLNPDGAARYTRENVNKIDLNRDAQNLEETESKVLRSCYKEFAPDICFNLHDQRTIFSVGSTNKPATVSFLTPAENPERNITPSRKKSMQIVAAMNAILQEFLPGGIGRYDDAFNINCTGDTFQSMGTPTILFEAGHFVGDYQREKTREYITVAILKGLSAVATESYREYSEKDYNNIPNNEKNFFDVILRRALVHGKIQDIGIQYREKVKGRSIQFVPVVQVMAANLSEFGHKEIDCHRMEVKSDSGQNINENDIVGKILLNKEELSIKPHDIP